MFGKRENGWIIGNFLFFGDNGVEMLVQAIQLWDRDTPVAVRTSRKKAEEKGDQSEG